MYSGFTPLFELGTASLGCFCEKFHEDSLTDSFIRL